MEIKLIKSLYTKESLLYTINLCLEDVSYEVGETDTEYVVYLGDETKDSDVMFFKRELNFNNLRFLIANNNKEMRKTIISKALGSINIE